jgi:hypothetical protein
MAYLAGALAQDAPPETAVYSRGGRFAFRRIGNVCYKDGQRIYYVDASAVYDQNGAQRFNISGVWWYGRDGAPIYIKPRRSPTRQELKPRRNVNARRNARPGGGRRSRVEPRRKPSSDAGSGSAARGCCECWDADGED